jgi:hypothetical protein
MIKTRIFANLSAFSAPELPLHCRSAFQADREVEEAFSRQDTYCIMHDYARAKIAECKSEDALRLFFQQTLVRRGVFNVGKSRCVFFIWTASRGSAAT